MILTAEDDRFVKIEPRDNGWVAIEVHSLGKDGEWKIKSITLTASEIIRLHDKMAGK
jgi:hypothetical protein